MPDYDSLSEEFVNRDWRDRFPEWAIGIDNWKNQPPPATDGETFRSLDWLPELGSRDENGTPLPCLVCPCRTGK
jgi:hypothetical protein